MIEFGRCTIQSATLRGVEAVPVAVEAVVSRGLPKFSIVGMPDCSIQESRERVAAAVRACGFAMPGGKIVVNLAPGSLRKSGSGFDLPIAVALLAATGQIPIEAVEKYLLVGELSLDGNVRPVPGLLAYALCARSQGLGMLSADSPGQTIPMEGLDRRVAGRLSDFRKGEFARASASVMDSSMVKLDFCDVAGHELAKRALQIAAAGGHGVLMMGPPGSGKSMLAKRMPSILPPLSQDEMMESAVVHSVAGEDASRIFAGERPFRSPHHSMTLAGLVGGGTPMRPGEVSLAHQGVLFLDELPEFKNTVLQGMRQPIEEGRVLLSRADGNVAFPSRFALVAASNPCPCGFFGDPDRVCLCPEHRIRAYQARIGGPLLDRIDIRIDVRRLPPSQVLACGKGTSSQELLEGVLKGKDYANWRSAREDDVCEADHARMLVASCRLSEEDRAFLEDAAVRQSLSGRGIVRVLSLARTIADMAESWVVGRSHLHEALSLRLHEEAS